MDEIAPGIGMFRSWFFFEVEPDWYQIRDRRRIHFANRPSLLESRRCVRRLLDNLTDPLAGLPLKWPYEFKPEAWEE